MASNDLRALRQPQTTRLIRRCGRPVHHTFLIRPANKHRVQHGTTQVRTAHSKDEPADVRDENNAVVNNAMVILYGTNTAGTPQQVAVFDTAYSNSSGLASFNYNDLYQLGQAGVAVLDIKAQKQNKSGQGIIKIEAEKENEETVFIQP